MLQFIRAYIKSMRLYYSFVTGIGGWVGVAYYEYLADVSPEHTIEIAPTAEKKLIILILLFLSWGINQIINDYLGLQEDRINASQRPMVTGELNPHWALFVSLILIVMSILITWFYLEPVAILFLVAGMLLNVVYEYAKGFGILGNIVFGLMMTMAPLYGFYASGPSTASVFASHRLSVIILIWLINALMTFYTYFKDYHGDKVTGKRTLVVKYGPAKARSIALFSAFLPTLVFLLLRGTGMHQTELNLTFIILGILTVFMQIWTGVLYFKHPLGIKTYVSLKTNFRACTCGLAALIAIFNPDLAIWLFIFSYIFVGFLFELHGNPQE